MSTMWFLWAAPGQRVSAVTLVAALGVACASTSTTTTSTEKPVAPAAASAQSLGFAPHPDYKKACRVLGGIGPVAPSVPWIFGHEGKPHNVQGPHDSYERAMQIMTQLRIHCGEGNFDFTILDEADDRN